MLDLPTARLRLPGGALKNQAQLPLKSLPMKTQQLKQWGARQRQAGQRPRENAIGKLGAGVRWMAKGHFCSVSEGARERWVRIAHVTPRNSAGKSTVST